MNPQSPDSFGNLLEFLRRLNQARIAYRLEHVREDTILVAVAVPGERWEIEFFSNGNVESERFRSDGHIGDGSVIDELFEKFSDLPDKE